MEVVDSHIHSHAVLGLSTVHMICLQVGNKNKGQAIANSIEDIIYFLDEGEKASILAESKVLKSLF